MGKKSHRDCRRVRVGCVMFAQPAATPDLSVSERPASVSALSEESSEDDLDISDEQERANLGRSHGCARVCQCHPIGQLAHPGKSGEKFSLALGLNPGPWHGRKKIYPLRYLNKIKKSVLKRVCKLFTRRFNTITTLHRIYL